MTSTPQRSEVEIRPVLPAEYDTVGALTATVYTDVLGSIISDEYRAELRDVARRAREAVVLVAADETGRLLGSVTYVPGPGRYAEFDGAGEAGIRMLVVDPQVQRRGVGTALVRACIDRARAGGRSLIVLHTVEEMPAARRLYERLGFRRAPLRDIHLGSGAVLVGYELGLRP